MVHPWQPEDRQGTIETVREVFEEYGFSWDELDYHADLYDVPRYYLSEENLFFVADDGEKVVGTVALEFFEPVPGIQVTICDCAGKIRVAGTDCSLERLYVRPNSRKNGIGTELMEKVIQEARARGRTAIEIWSDKRFNDAHKLYERFGAIIVGDRICDDPDLSPEWGLILQL